MGSPVPLARQQSGLRLIAAVSGLYDLALGLLLLVWRGTLADWFAVPPPVPPIHADLNGVFLLAVAVGYLLPLRDPERYRGYLWVMGPFLKGVGALTFVMDVAVRGSPASFLLLAATDGTLAAATLAVLLGTRPTDNTKRTPGPLERRCP